MLLKKNYVNCLKSVETFRGFDLKRGNKLCEKIKVKIHQGGLHFMIEKSWSVKQL